MSPSSIGGGRVGRRAETAKFVYPVIFQENVEYRKGKHEILKYQDTLRNRQWCSSQTNWSIRDWVVVRPQSGPDTLLSDPHVPLSPRAVRSTVRTVEKYHPSSRPVPRVSTLVLYHSDKLW